MSSRNPPQPNAEDHPSNLNEQGQEDDSFSLGLDPDTLGPGNLGEDFAAETNATHNQDDHADPNENPETQTNNEANASGSTFNPQNTPLDQQQHFSNGSYPYQTFSQGTPFNPRRRSFFSRPTQPTQQPFGNYSQPPFGVYPQPPFGNPTQQTFGTQAKNGHTKSI